MQTIDLGYSITEGCLTNHECDKIVEALSSDGVLRSRAGARHLMINPVAATLARSARLVELSQEWLGNIAIPFRATLFEKTPTTNWLITWHQDTALPLTRRFEAQGWGPWSRKECVTYAHAPACALSRVVALRVHLDGSNEDNGPLRVMPGSHKSGVLTDAAVLEWVSTHQEVTCLTQRGGVIAMRPLLIHSSSKTRSVEPRRVLHIEYADSLDLGCACELAVA
jgi:ectoine hydroxylase-related dioxygenase (phytanoyl-CoA dioxygenase family)